MPKISIYMMIKPFSRYRQTAATLQCRFCPSDQSMPHVHGGCSCRLSHSTRILRNVHSVVPDQLMPWMHCCRWKTCCAHLAARSRVFAIWDGLGAAHSTAAINKQSRPPVLLHRYAAGSVRATLYSQRLRTGAATTSRKYWPPKADAFSLPRSNAIGQSLSELSCRRLTCRLRHCRL